MSEEYKCCKDLFVAYDKKHLECFELLLNTNDIEENNYFGQTILNFICQYGCKIEYIKLLLEHKADVNTKDNYTFTPLIAIIKFNNTECLKLLLENKADINAKTKYGNTALIIAVRNNKYDHVKLLLEHNADPTIVNSYGKTTLNYAKENSNDEIVKLLEQYIYNNIYNTMMEIFDESSTGMLDDLTELAMQYYI